MSLSIDLEDGRSEEVYKILRQSSVDKQHMECDDTYQYQMYRPYCVDGLPVFTIGNHSHRNPAQEGDIVSVMVGGVVEAPIIEGSAATAAPGDVVYAAHDGTNPYLTTDETDTNIVCCWGIIIDNQYPLHYGEAVLAGEYATLHNVRMLKPACTAVSEL